MTNFDLHEQAQQLADTRSAYSLARELLELQASRTVWRNVGSPNGLRRFMTQKQYDVQTPGVQKWYEPIRHEAPEGWKLVPVEPTQEMLTIGALYPDSYSAMLAAAPKLGEL